MSFPQARLGIPVINIVPFTDAVQSVDPRIPALESLFQMRTGSHVLIAWPVKFNPRLSQRFLNIYLATALTSFFADLSFLVRHLVKNPTTFWQRLGPLACLFSWRNF